MSGSFPGPFIQSTPLAHPCPEQSVETSAEFRVNSASHAETKNCGLVCHLHRDIRQNVADQLPILDSSSLPAVTHSFHAIDTIEPFAAILPFQTLAVATILQTEPGVILLSRTAEVHAPRILPVQASRRVSLSLGGAVVMATAGCVVKPRGC